MPTLAERLEPSAVGFGELEAGYKPMLEIVSALIGVVPNCDAFLEIWPPGFRTYNLVVPNMLNLPASLLARGAAADKVGLALYTSSRAAECAYCSAHTCSFALRRGATPDAVTGSDRTPAEQAVVDMSETLSTIPATFGRSQFEAMRRHFSAEDTEWIALGSVMMGFLNKFMDAMGIELEPEAISDVTSLISPTGWSPGQHARDDVDIDLTQPDPPVDSWKLRARVLRHGPGAARIEKRWLADVPSSQAELRDWLEGRTGLDEPLLDRFLHPKPARAIAAVLAENLDQSASVLGLEHKARAARIFGQAIGSDHVADLAASLPPPEEDVKSVAIVEELVRAMSPSPAQVDDDLSARAAELLEPSAIIELAVWLSVLQMLHRWERFSSVAYGNFEA